MVIYQHELREQSIRQRIVDYKQVVARDTAPPCECKTVELGKSGNMGLDTKASYSAFKHCCFPGLRTFLYADGPKYLTKITRLPDVREIDKHNHLVYT